jgi:hypothetical protein
VSWGAELLESDTSADSQAQPSTTAIGFLADPAGPSSKVLKNGKLIEETQQNTLRLAPTSTDESLQDCDSTSDEEIGAVLKNRKYKCNAAACADKIYGRPAELRRHYDTIHAIQKPEFWCEVMFCTRKEAAGNKPFSRKYRLEDHMRKVHNNEANVGDHIDMTEGYSTSE